jgi:hypothetical protein
MIATPNRVYLKFTLNHFSEWACPLNLLDAGSISYEKGCYTLST